MSSNAINDVSATTTPPTITENNIFNQKQIQSTVPKTTGLIDDVKISTVLPNSIDNIGESYTFYQKPNDSMATTFNITNDENLATNNIQNIKTVGKENENENEKGLNTDNSNSVEEKKDTQISTTLPPSSYPEIPLTANTKKKRSRNPSKIPRPQNCFIIYRREKHQIISAENPGIANNDISKIIAKMWREEPPEVKEIYHQRAKEEAKRHMLANPGYKYTPRASKNRRKRKLNDENKKFEENHPLKHEFDNPPHQGKNHENIRHWIDNISSPSQEQNIINTLAQGSQNINSYSMVNPLQTSFEDPLYSSSNSGSLAYSSCSSASTSSTNLSVYSWSSNSLSSSNLSRGSSISNINEYGNIQQPPRIYEYEFQKPVTTQIYNPYDYKLTQQMSQMHIQQQPQVQNNPQIVLNVQQPNTTLPLQIQATTQQIQNPIQAQIAPPMQMQAPIQAQITSQNVNIQQPQINAQISPPMQATNTQNMPNTIINNLPNPTQSSQGTITYATTNIPNNIAGKPQYITVTNPQIQTVYATQPNNIGGIPTYTSEIINPQFQEVKQMPPAQYQQQFYNVSTQIPNMNNQGNFQNIYNENREGRPN